MKRLFLVGVIVLTAVLLGGCTIRLSSRPQDGGVFRSTDFGEHWDQTVFVRQERSRTITISAADVSNFVLSPFDPDELVITTLENGAFATTNSGDSWQPTALSTGNVRAFVYDPANPALLYAAIGANVFKSTDSGMTWEIIYTDTRGELITAIAIDRYEPSRVFAGTNGGTILASVNYGNDWSVKQNVRDPVRSIFFRADDTRFVYIVTTNQGLVRSTDGGVTWTSLLPAVAEFPGAGTVYQLAYSPNRPLIFYLATNFGVLRSDDGGETWQALQTLLPPNSIPVRTVAVEAGDDRVIYFTVNNLLHKTEDGGKTWRTIETIPTGRLIVRLFAHPTKPGVIYLGTFKPD
ncbi:MAG: hypothetical protein HY340_01635 [Candidatus Kerfeldbacteria bacterium]|nr:hypothetical protein [Candidatus Kerfeldbacteria bacterium]